MAVFLPVNLCFFTFKHFRILFINGTPCYSKEFANCAALILCANGIKAYIFENLGPVPQLSFAVRKLNTAAGIMITASHNPPKYNGYKVYGEDGSQIISPIDKQIMEEVRNITDFA